VIFVIKQDIHQIDVIKRMEKKKVNFKEVNKVVLIEHHNSKATKLLKEIKFILNACIVEEIIILQITVILNKINNNNNLVVKYVEEIIIQLQIVDKEQKIQKPLIQM